MLTVSWVSLQKMCTYDMYLCLFKLRIIVACVCITQDSLQIGSFNYQNKLKGRNDYQTACWIGGSSMNVYYSSIWLSLYIKIRIVCNYLIYMRLWLSLLLIAPVSIILCDLISVPINWNGASIYLNVGRENIKIKQGQNTKSIFVLIYY